MKNKYLVQIVIIMILAIILSSCTPKSSSLEHSTESDTVQNITTESAENDTTKNQETESTEESSTNKDNFTIKDYELTKLDGTKVKLSEVTEDLTLVAFWATWCKYCIKEMPDMEEISKKENVSVIMLNVRESEDTVKKFMEEKGYKLDIYLDVEGKIADDFGVTGFPTTAFMNKDRMLYLIQPGIILMEDFNFIVEKIDEYNKKEKSNEKSD